MYGNAVYVVYAKLEENYGAPFKVFQDYEAMEKWLETNKDSYGLEYCWDELEIE